MSAKLEDFARHRSLRRHASEKEFTRKAPSGCPICGATPSRRHQPFCSVRCADIDLARWLNETYRVPGETAERPDEPDPDSA